MGLDACKEPIAAAECVAPRSFLQHPASSARRMGAMAQYMLQPCELTPGQSAVDCSEFPCVLFVERAGVEAEACPVTRSMARRAKPVEVALEPGEKVWDMLWLLHPDDRAAGVTERAVARWQARLRHTEPQLDDPEAIREGAVALDCDGRAAVLEADDDEALCEALLDYWGCDAPDPEAYAQRVAHAEAVVEEALRPGCSTLDPELTLLDCSRSPCTLTYLEDRTPEERRTQPSFCARLPMLPHRGKGHRIEGAYLMTRAIWPDDPDARAAAIERWEQEEAFRTADAWEAWKAEYAEAE